MAKGIFARIFGSRGKNTTTTASTINVTSNNNNNNKKPQPVKKSRVVAAVVTTPSSATIMSQKSNLPPTPPPKTTSSVPTNVNNSTTSSLPLTNNNNNVNNNTVQQPTVEKEENSHYFFSDLKDKLTDMNDFINTQGNNDIELYLKNLSNLDDRVSYGEDVNTTTNDEFMTLSSSTSSSLSLQDALFSHFSANTDTRSEISAFSSVYSPKITIRTQQESPSSSHYDDSLFDRRFSVADTNSTTSKQYYNTISEFPNTVAEEREAVFFEKQFCNLYLEALELLSNTSKTYSPARAFTNFEFIANKGYQAYQTLNARTKTLVSFAQYRAGRMLCEATDDDNNSNMMEQGLLYLLESSRNGNGRADFLLGCYAEKRGEIDHACRLYHRAAIANILPAKVSFGRTVLFSGVPGFQVDDAIYMLEEASSEGHAIASLSLALYYEKISLIDLAIKYCRRVQIDPSSPIFCVSSYQMGVIYLKGGRNYADVAFRCIAAASKAVFLENGEPSLKFTTPLRKLGVLSLMGIGTPQNSAAAFSFIQEAAKLGDEPANIILGQMYLMGLGCPVDLSRAMEIFHNYGDNIAAKLSRGLLIMKENPSHAYREFQDVIHHPVTAFDEEHWDVTLIKYEALTRIAVWEYNGIGGAEKNPARAFQTLHKLSDEFNYSGAHYWLAWAYMDGVKLEDGTVIVSADSDQGFKYFLKGARQNRPDCQYRIGRMLKEGYSNAMFQKKDAFAFFLKAADQDYSAALTMVGVYYYTGSIGTENGRDLNKAFNYFSAAAKHNEPLAIQYLADYMIKNNSIGPIDRYHIYNELNRAAGVEQDPIAYRMLALVVDSGIDPSETYEANGKSNVDHPVYDDLLQLYIKARKESLANNTDVKFRFTLYCLWKAIELNDHQSGNFLCNFVPRMNHEDISKTIETFEKAEGPIPSKMAIAFAQFLKASNNKSNALAKFIEVAKFNEVTTSTGWSSRLEAAKLVLNENQGKARSKAQIFAWLHEMISYNGKNLFIPLILLGKCHEGEICNGCTKDLAPSYFEQGLKSKIVDVSLEVYARMKLVEIYYNTSNQRLIEQLNLAEPLVNSLPQSSDKNHKLSQLYYYKGLLSLHNGTIYNYREKARHFLTQSHKLGNILACLELGYLYGTIESKEEEADKCFQEVESSKTTPITFKNRLTEALVQVRTDNIRTNNDYLVEINKMKLAAGITYSYYNMERQAIDWFKEISDNPIAKIMIMYYIMKDTQQRTLQNIRHLTNLIDPFEKMPSLDYYDSLAISYGQFRLGQCYQHGHGVSINNNMASDFYNKACVFLLNNETYERLAEISDLVGSDTNLFTTLLKAARNDTNAMFKLGQYYHTRNSIDGQDADIPSKKAATYYHEAAQAGHAESCYYYAKYLIDKTLKSTAHYNAASRSKPAVNYLRTAANRNHAPSFFELGKLEIEAGLFEEGVEDLEEAAFLNHGLACYELGELHRVGFTGVISGKVTFKIPQSNSEAMAYYSRAIENGCMLALLRKGSFFETGELGELSVEEARKCYTKAYTSQKCPGGTAEFALGCLEETCLSLSGAFPTNRQRKAAFDWFKKSLEAGNLNAKFKIGSYLLHNWVIETSAKEDEKRGLQILIEENGEGNVLAMKELARYFEEKGETQKAFGYWRNAELLNDPEALEHIALCFEKGLLGQLIDLEESYRYRSLAAEARKQAVETQRSMMGFKSDYSEERK